MRVVVKIGGSLLQQAGAGESWIHEIQRFVQEGHQVAVVHGGGPAITESLSRAGVAVSFHQGQRITTSEVLGHVVQVLRGQVNAALIVQMSRAGIAAVGLSGVDGGMLQARRLDEPDLGHVGKVAEVNPALIQALWQASMVPVVAPLAMERGGCGILNCNGDGVAAALAVGLQADLMVFFTERGGLRESPEPGAALVRQIAASDIAQWISSGRANAGMVPKLESARDALRHGVPTVLIGSYYDAFQGSTEFLAD